MRPETGAPGKTSAEGWFLVTFLRPQIQLRSTGYVRNAIQSGEKREKRKKRGPARVLLCPSLCFVSLNYEATR